MDVSVFSVIFNDFCSIFWVLLNLTLEGCFYGTHCSCQYFLVLNPVRSTRSVAVRRTSIRSTRSVSPYVGRPSGRLAVRRTSVRSRHTSDVRPVDSVCLAVRRTSVPVDSVCLAVRRTSVRSTRSVSPYVRHLSGWLGFSLYVKHLHTVM